MNQNANTTPSTPRLTTMTPLRLNVQTDQQAFDRVVAHLATMPGRAIKPGTHQCQYRTESGNRCAIGALITDRELGGRTFDTASVSGLPIANCDIRASLLFELQRIHDTADNWHSPDGFNPRNGEFKGWDALRHLAERYDLDYTLVDRLAFV